MQVQAQKTARNTFRNSKRPVNYVTCRARSGLDKRASQPSALASALIGPVELPLLVAVLGMGRKPTVRQ